jgi:hypothetical protein
MAGEQTAASEQTVANETAAALCKNWLLILPPKIHLAVHEP